jgi:hypothetical protein
MAGNSVEHFAAAADDARSRFAFTIDEIQDRVDPRRLVGDAVDRVSGGGMQVLDQARNIARGHPLAIAAGVAAIAIALLARNTLANAKVDLGDELGDYTDYDDGFGFAETRARTGAAPDGEADDSVQTLRRSAPGSRLNPPALAAGAGAAVEANPIVAIVLGLAAGAALGALFPTSETERRALGDAGGRLGAAAKAAARRAADELEAAGINIENVRAKAGAASQQARQAARAVVAAARDELKA